MTRDDIIRKYKNSLTEEQLSELCELVDRLQKEPDVDLNYSIFKFVLKHDAANRQQKSE